MKIVLRTVKGKFYVNAIRSVLESVSSQADVDINDVR